MPATDTQVSEARRRVTEAAAANDVQALKDRMADLAKVLAGRSAESIEQEEQEKGIQ